MKNILAKVALVACLFTPLMANAENGKSVTTTYAGSSSSDAFQFTLDSKSNVTIHYSWSDMLLQKGHEDPLASNASSLAWTLTGPTAKSGTFADSSDVSSVFDKAFSLGKLTAGSYTLTFTGTWAAKTLPGNDYVGMTNTAGKVDLIDVGISKGNSFTALQVTAVPEPETYAMLLAGLGVLGAVARRKQGVKGTAARC